MGFLSIHKQVKDKRKANISYKSNPVFIFASLPHRHVDVCGVDFLSSEQRVSSFYFILVIIFFLVYNNLGDKYVLGPLSFGGK